MMIIRQYYSRAKEEMHGAVVSMFTFVMILGLKALLFNRIPEIFNHCSPISLSKMICTILLIISCVLILGRKKAGVWLWLLTIAIILIIVSINKGMSGFTMGFTARIAFFLFILVWCLSLKKDGKTTWSVLK